MATELELADITAKLVDELSVKDAKIATSTLKLFSALSATEQKAVSGALKERLARLGQASQLRRQRGQQQFQLRRDAAKEASQGIRDASRERLARGAQAGVLRGQRRDQRFQTQRDAIREAGQAGRDQSKLAGQIRILDRKSEIAERQKSAPQRAKDLQRTIGVRNQQATGSIRRARGISGSPEEVQRSLRLLAEVDPEAARTLGDNFRRDPGSRIRASVPRGLEGFPTGPSRAGNLPPRSTGRELAVRPSGGQRIVFDELKLEKLASSASRRKLGKFGLIGGAALTIPLILSAIRGEGKSEQLDPAAQFQLMQALQSSQGGGVDPDLQQGRQLRNVLNLLNIIKQLRGMESTLAQPTTGIV